MSFLPKLNALFSVQKVKEVDGAHVWIVSWNARTGDYSHDINRVAKAFLLEEDANQFAESLQQAQALLQNTNNLRIKIEKQL
jgi:hypothetical protein